MSSLFAKQKQALSPNRNSFLVRKREKHLQRVSLFNSLLFQAVNLLVQETRKRLTFGRKEGIGGREAGLDGEGGRMDGKGKDGEGAGGEIWAGKA